MVIIAKICLHWRVGDQGDSGLVVFNVSLVGRDLCQT
jgi:hypothetical protein